MTSSAGDDGDPRRGAVKVKLSEFEEEMFASFGSFAAKEINVCERTATYIAALIQRTGPGPIRTDPDTELTVQQLRLGAMTGIAIRTLRAMRAALAVLSIGYEVEGGVYDRLLIELRGRLAQVTEDSSGEAARQWLEGQAPTRINRLWANSTMRDLYAGLSRAVHADSRAFGPLVEPDLNTLFFGPRRTQMTRASLIAQSVVGYDVIAKLSQETGIVIDGVSELFVEIGEAALELGVDMDKLNPDELGADR